MGFKHPLSILVLDLLNKSKEFGPMKCHRKFRAYMKKWKLKEVSWTSLIPIVDKIFENICSWLIEQDQHQQDSPYLVNINWYFVSGRNENQGLQETCHLQNLLIQTPPNPFSFSKFFNMWASSSQPRKSVLV